MNNYAATKYEHGLLLEFQPCNLAEGPQSVMDKRNRVNSFWISKRPTRHSELLEKGICPVGTEKGYKGSIRLSELGDGSAQRSESICAIPLCDDIEKAVNHRAQNPSLMPLADSSANLLAVISCHQPCVTSGDSPGFSSQGLGLNMI